MVKVLIDDDILIQLGKQLEADKMGERLDCFFSVDEFLAVADKYPKETMIYIDSNLGTEVLGEEDSKRIAERGYKNIFLSSGYTDISLEKYPWIKGFEKK
ncbi:MAG: hypothetical protein WDA09_06875 [Bacteriovoracaceae bacterium]